MYDNLIINNQYLLALVANLNNQSFTQGILVHKLVSTSAFSIF